MSIQNHVEKIIIHSAMKIDDPYTTNISRDSSYYRLFDTQISQWQLEYDIRYEYPHWQLNFLDNLITSFSDMTIAQYAEKVALSIEKSPPVKWGMALYVARIINKCPIEVASEMMIIKPRRLKNIEKGCVKPTISEISMIKYFIGDFDMLYYLTYECDIYQSGDFF